MRDGVHGFAAALLPAGGVHIVDVTIVNVVDCQGANRILQYPPFLRSCAHALESKGVDFRSWVKERRKSAQWRESKGVAFCAWAKEIGALGSLQFLLGVAGYTPPAVCINFKTSGLREKEFV